jgi:hypothetical protein
MVGNGGSAAAKILTILMVYPGRETRRLSWGYGRSDVMLERIADQLAEIIDLLREIVEVMHDLRHERALRGE